MPRAFRRGPICLFVAELACTQEADRATTKSPWLILILREETQRRKNFAEKLADLQSNALPDTWNEVVRTGLSPNKGGTVAAMQEPAPGPASDWNEEKIGKIRST